jgi:hypothetical protein
LKTIKYNVPSFSSKAVRHFPNVDVNKSCNMLTYTRCTACDLWILLLLLMMIMKMQRLYFCSHIFSKIPACAADIDIYRKTMKTAQEQ